MFGAIGKTSCGLTTAPTAVQRWMVIGMDDWDDYDVCYECTGYGDDYYIDKNGELVCACDECPINGRDYEDD